MILIWLITILFAGGILAWITGRWNNNVCRWISLVTLAAGLVITISLWLQFSPSITPAGAKAQNWLIDYNSPWIPQIGVSLHFAMDGLSLLMIGLTMFLGFLSVLVSWNQVTDKVGFFHFNLLWILAGISGVFVAMDLFLFYFFWEVMLIPMYFIIAIWGYENRIYASFKFFIYTQASGLLMLIAILALYFIHGSNTGDYTFDYTKLLGTQFSSSAGMWMMLGFLFAFAVKLPVVPFHNWLPDAHTEAPTAGSVILAGLLLKTGAYGIIRFVLPLFPDASQTFAPYGMALGAIGILYGAMLAFGQQDFKRLVAYSSVSHMGFVMVGVYAFNQLALQGVVMQMIAHGVSTGALFIIVGAIQKRIHTRDLDEMGGFWENIPRMGGITLVFTMASLGLPGLGNFIAEFLTLAGAFQANVFWTVIASTGLVAATIYSLRIMQKVFYGRHERKWTLKDFDAKELFVMGLLIIAIVWTGIYPQAVINNAKIPVNNTLNYLNNSQPVDSTAAGSL